MEDLSDYVSDDELAVEPFRELGWQVEFIPWTADETWSRFDAVLIRSTWDYFIHLETFLAVLERIHDATTLLNPLDVVRWNMRKTYLLDLQERGVEIVPTFVGGGLAPNSIEALFAQLQADRIVIKPVVSGGAYRTFLLARDAVATERSAVADSFGREAFIAQPFVDSVLHEGEYSVFYFDGCLSHTVVKTPKAKDFRVQEEYGGTIREVAAPAGLEKAARRAFEAVDPSPLYARVDLVRGAAGSWMVMEIELIEPSLYLRSSPGAPVRFACAFDAWTSRNPL